MAVIKNKVGHANQEYWSHIEEVAKEVKKWPQWMGNRCEGTETENESQSKPNRVRAASANGGPGLNND